MEVIEFAEIKLPEQGTLETSIISILMVLSVSNYRSDLVLVLITYIERCVCV